MFLKIIVLCISVTFVYADCDPCPRIPTHYEELGCKGVQDENDCCPTRFDCPDFNSYDPSKCHLNGRSYDVFHQLNENEVPGLAGCTCLNHTDPAKFNCAIIECPELFGKYEPHCVQQYTFDKTCAINKVCNKNEIDQLHKCHYKDEEYYDGQFIYPSDGCYKCLCNEAFDNGTLSENNVNCKKIECKIEILYLDRIKNGCVPVYFGENSCCPIDFKCPSDTDEIEQSGRSIDEDSGKTCKHGNHTLAIGDSLKSDSECVECKCVKPPMLECIKVKDCETKSE